MAGTAVHTDILNGIVDYYFRGEAMPEPLSEVYLGLVLDSAGTEVAGGNYSRIPIFGKMDAPDNGLCRNGIAIAFPKTSAGWGKVVGIGFYDSLEEGNLLAGGMLRQAKEVMGGDQFTLGPGVVQLSLAANITPFFRDSVLRWMLYGETMPTPPSKPYVGLLRSSNTTDEVSGGGYVRVAVSGNFDPATGGATTNALPIPFATPTDPWGTITHLGFFDAPAGGEAYFITPLDSAFTPFAGDTIRFNIASIVLRVSGA